MKGKKLYSKIMTNKTPNKSKKKGESIKLRESIGTGRLKIQNSATNNDHFNNVNYESDGEDA